MRRKYAEIGRDRINKTDIVLVTTAHPPPLNNTHGYGITKAVTLDNEHGPAREKELELKLNWS